MTTDDRFDLFRRRRGAAVRRVRLRAPLRLRAHGERTAALELRQRSTAPVARHASAALDIGTGGGELLTLLRPFPPHMCATEGYVLNLPIARSRQAPLGVAVYSVGEDNRLPFCG